MKCVIREQENVSISNKTAWINDLSSLKQLAMINCPKARPQKILGGNMIHPRDNYTSLFWKLQNFVFQIGAFSTQKEEPTSQVRPSCST